MIRLPWRGVILGILSGILAVASGCKKSEDSITETRYTDGSFDVEKVEIVRDDVRYTCYARTNNT